VSIDPYGESLRRALTAEADHVVPAGDGLARIQQRVARRASRLRVLRPALAVLSVLVVLAGGLVTVSLLGDDGGVGELRTINRPAAPSAEPAPAATQPTGEPTAGPAPAPAVPVPPVVGPPVAVPPAQGGGDTAVPDLATSWPYSSRSEARAHIASAGPEMTDPRAVALRFVLGFLQRPEVDRVTGVRSQDAGLGVTVGRRVPESGRVIDVTTVYLVRVAASDSAPYVVVSATAPYLSITGPAAGAAIRSPLTVSGRITGVDESIRVDVRVLSRPAPIGSARTPGGGDNSPWSAPVSFPATADRGATVVAWTDSAVDGLVARLAAQPVALPGR